MPRLIWSPHALRDVQRLYRFLAGKNTQAARRAAKSIREGVKVIAHQPGIGRLVSFRQACMKWDSQSAYVHEQEDGSWHEKVRLARTGE